jgi:hypothetical protein
MNDNTEKWFMLPGLQVDENGSGNCSVGCLTFRSWFLRFCAPWRKSPPVAGRDWSSFIFLFMWAESHISFTNRSRSGSISRMALLLIFQADTISSLHGTIWRHAKIDSLNLLPVDKPSIDSRLDNDLHLLCKADKEVDFRQGWYRGPTYK